MAPRISAESAKKLFLRNKLRPLEVFVDSQKPWKSKCLKCGKTVSPNYAKVKARGHQCSYCAGNRVDPNDALSVMKKAGFLPMTKYPGGNKAWKVKCKGCRRVYKIKMHSRSSIAKCAYCAGIKVEVKDVYAHLKKIGLKPLEKYVNARTPIRCRCESCLRIIAPSWSHLKNKKSGCAYCARRRVVPEEQIALMLKSKLDQLHRIKIQVNLGNVCV